MTKWKHDLGIKIEGPGKVIAGAAVFYENQLSFMRTNLENEASLVTYLLFQMRAMPRSAHRPKSDAPEVAVEQPVETGSPSAVMVNSC